MTPARFTSFRLVPPGFAYIYRATRRDSSTSTLEKSASPFGTFTSARSSSESRAHSPFSLRSVGDLSQVSTLDAVRLRSLALMSSRLSLGVHRIRKRIGSYIRVSFQDLVGRRRRTSSLGSISGTREHRPKRLGLDDHLSPPTPPKRPIALELGEHVGHARSLRADQLRHHGAEFRIGHSRPSRPKVAFHTGKTLLQTHKPAHSRHYRQRRPARSRIIPENPARSFHLSCDRKRLARHLADSHLRHRSWIDPEAPALPRAGLE